jgi:hypothetical protein
VLSTVVEECRERHPAAAVAAAMVAEQVGDGQGSTAPVAVAVTEREAALTTTTEAAMAAVASASQGAIVPAGQTVPRV